MPNCDFTLSLISPCPPWEVVHHRSIQVEDTRSQARNREIARDRLAELVLKATQKPKRRIPTKPTLGSKKRRLASKKQRGEVKSLRGKVDPDS